MFLINKYTKTYYRIIERAKSRLKLEGYTEKHHIIPKCKPFCGPNTKDNLVNLTLREHYICHLLLLKMVKNSLGKAKMFCAFQRMGNCGKPFSRFYDFFRTTFLNQISGKNSPCYGIKRPPFSEEWKNKMSLSHRKKNSKEHIKATSESCSRFWEITFPNGHKEIIKNKSQFCREHNLSSGNMTSLSQGKLKYYKGYKCSKLTDVVK
jgi:hypothetical protein